LNNFTDVSSSERQKLSCNDPGDQRWRCAGMNPAVRGVGHTGFDKGLESICSGVLSPVHLSFSCNSPLDWPRSRRTQHVSYFITAPGKDEDLTIVLGVN
jgi:hypothetical protein